MKAVLMVLLATVISAPAIADPPSVQSTSRPGTTPNYFATVWYDVLEQFPAKQQLGIADNCHELSLDEGPISCGQVRLAPPPLAVDLMVNNDDMD